MLLRVEAVEPDVVAEVFDAPIAEQPSPAGSMMLQAATLVAVWAYVVCLHLSNDGLWYSGDAARHALNGLFWGDAIASQPAQPMKFALQYYARYPAINPTSYPPFFYLLEAAAFAVLGPSPLVAKGLVLTFTLVGGFYVMAWLRRGVSPEAGWGAALLVLQPGVLSWSHAILLNVPSMTLALAALYHARRWLDDADTRQLRLAAGLAVIGVLTYFPTLLVFPVVVGWIVFEGHWRELNDRQALIVSALFLAVVVTVVTVASKWSPLHFALIRPSPSLLQLGHWTYYLHALPQNFAFPTLALCAVALIGAVADAPTRAQAMPVIIGIAMMYLSLSYLTERETRYILLLAPMIVILAVIGLSASCRWVAGRDPQSLTLSLVLLILVHAVIGRFVNVPRLDGMRELVQFLEREAPNERIFYEGDNNGAFTFYVRAGDPHFQRGVVRGSKLLYSSAIFSNWRLKERATSSAEVVRILRREGGSRWIAIERPRKPDTVAAVTFLREALTGPDFEFVRSFPLESTSADRVDLYRIVGDVETPTHVSLPFPILRPDAEFVVEPIAPRP